MRLRVLDLGNQIQETNVPEGELDLSRRCHVCKVEVQISNEAKLSWQSLDFCGDTCIGNKKTTKNASTVLQQLLLQRSTRVSLAHVVPAARATFRRPVWENTACGSATTLGSSAPVNAWRSSRRVSRCAAIVSGTFLRRLEDFLLL